MFVNACRKESIDIQEENTKCFYNYKLSEVFNSTYAYSYTLQGYFNSITMVHFQYIHVCRSVYIIYREISNNINV